jgi:MFS family permease
VVVLTAIGSLMAALDTLVVSTALTTIRLDLGASLEQLEWTVNAYNLSFAVLLITGAALGDRYGRRNLYAIGLALFALSATFAPAIGPTIGGYLTENWGWQYIFYVNLVPGALMVGMLWS